MNESYLVMRKFLKRANEANDALSLVATTPQQQLHYQMASVGLLLDVVEQLVDCVEQLENKP